MIPHPPLPATAKWHRLWVLPTLKSKCCPNRSPLSFRLKTCPIKTTLNDAFNSAVDLLSFIDNKRKNLYTEEHTSKPFASDELKYFQEVHEGVKAIYEELQKASNKLTTTLMSLKRKFSPRMGNNRQSRRKKEA